MRSHEATNNDFLRFGNHRGNPKSLQMSLDLAVCWSWQKNCLPAPSPTRREPIDDINPFIKQLLVEIDSHAHAIDSIDCAYSTVANNTLNQRMRVPDCPNTASGVPNVFFGTCTA